MQNVSIAHVFLFDYFLLHLFDKIKLYEEEQL